MSTKGRLAIAVAVALTLAGCARSRSATQPRPPADASSVGGGRDAGDDPDDRADAPAERAGRGGSVAPDEAGRSATDGAPAAMADAEVRTATRACGRFLAIWIQRNAERQPGEPSPAEGADAPCFECVETAACPEPQDATTSCIRSHCQCSQPIDPSCREADYPSDFCDCMAGCLPHGPSAKRDAYLTYVECMSTACHEVCERAADP